MAVGYSHLTSTFVIAVVCFLTVSLGSRYDPNWDSLDTRPNPEWYDKAKIGIFISWGVYSVPGFSDEWFWYYWKGSKYPSYVDFMKNNFPPGFTYPDFASDLKGTFFDADKWVDIVQSSGAGYVVLITKHHEGYTMWPSNYSWNWNSMDVGLKRDIVGEFADALRKKTNIHLGLYHSLFEWFNPLYLKDKENNYTTRDFPKAKVIPCLYELVNKYKPDYIWSDGVMGTSDVYWNSAEFVAWLYNDSPVKDTIVTNDRWGVEVMCHHGGVNTCHDRFNPGVVQKRKFENAMTLDGRSWGYRRNINIEEILSMNQLLTVMAETISCGGNLLINVGPTADGTISPIFQERLRDLGSWLKINGFGVYNTIPWKYQHDNVTKSVWYTSLDQEGTKVVFAFCVEWPKSGYLYLSVPEPTNFTATSVQMLNFNKPLPYVTPEYGGMNISVSVIPADVVMEYPGGWMFALFGLSNA